MSRTEIGHRKILTKAGKAAIRAVPETDVYRKRLQRREPPYMVPSTDEAAYSSVSIPNLNRFSSVRCSSSSKWCSLCGDLGAVLVLCSGCRVSVCVKTHRTVFGCLRWSEKIEDDQFIFYCPFCAMADRTVERKCPVGPLHSGLRHSPTKPILPQLILDDQLRRYSKGSILYRYDPPVLLIGATWHEKKVPFVELLGNFLKASYGHEDLVGA